MITERERRGVARQSWPDDPEAAVRLLQEDFPTWLIGYDLDPDVTWPLPVFCPYRGTRTFGRANTLTAPTPALLAEVIHQSISAGGWVDAVPLQ